MSKLSKWIRSTKLYLWNKKYPNLKSKIFYFDEIIRVLYCKNILSNKVNIIGNPVIRNPVIFKGKGKFMFGENVHFGGDTSPNFYVPSYIESRNSESVIKFGNNIFSNNNLTIIAEGLADNGGVVIGNDVLLGFNVTIVDSNFHDLNPVKRLATTEWGGGNKNFEG